MNFSVSVGELLLGINLCRKLRRDFASSPRQFQQIADQYVLKPYHINADSHVPNHGSAE